MNKRGTIVVELLVGAALLAGAATIGGWDPFKVFKKGPPVAEVQQARDEAEKAKAALKEAQDKLDALKNADADRKDSQVEYAQEMVAGAQEALKRQPAEHQTEQTVLATQFLDRTELALALAIGRLPEAQQQQIITLVDKALSKYAADRDEARRLLQLKDAELQKTARERDALKAEIPKFEQQVAGLKETVKAKDDKLVKAETKLGVWATIKDKADRHNASLSGQIDRIFRGFLWLAAIYVFLAFVLPAVVKVMPPGTAKNGLRIVAGISTSPILFLDAMRKLAARKDNTATP